MVLRLKSDMFVVVDGLAVHTGRAIANPYCHYADGGGVA